MNIGEVLLARGFYYDRAAANKTLQFFSSAIAPHGLTVRATYTVPTGKKAYVDHYMLQHIRTTAQAALSFADTYLRYTPSGGALTYIGHTFIFNLSVGATDRIVGSGTGFMATGDVIDIATSDSGATGSIDYYMAVKIFEFDA